MNNEPVAWMYKMKYSTNKWELIFNKPINDEFFETIPLYLHSVKELTDEEINQIVWQQNLLLGNDDLRKFARAILRKAQEK